MTAKFKDFIATWDNVLPSDFCEMLIGNFEQMLKVQNSLIDKQDNKVSLQRKDQSYILNYHNEYAPFVFKYLKESLDEYVAEFPQLTNLPMWPSEIKMQKTEPGGGFHVWHYESAGWDVAQRELAWMIYLNDLPDGEGETEFLYQKTRIKPTVGTLVIWPAAMTHVHRGNTVFTHDKYILTGWFIKLPKQ